MITCILLSAAMGCSCSLHIYDFQVIEWHFWLKKNEILAQLEEWIADLEKYTSDKRVGRSISLSLTSLKVHSIYLYSFLTINDIVFEFTVLTMTISSNI